MIWFLYSFSVFLWFAVVWWVFWIKTMTEEIKVSCIRQYRATVWLRLGKFRFGNFGLQWDNNPDRFELLHSCLDTFKRHFWIWKSIRQQEPKEIVVTKFYRKTKYKNSKIVSVWAFVCSWNLPKEIFTT